LRAGNKKKLIWPPIRPRWLQLADAALSATEKAAKALEIAREEQEHIRRDIRRKLANYSRMKRRKVKKVG